MVFAARIVKRFALPQHGEKRERVMNVFVTGGAGYIGSVCVEELLNAGHQVTVYDDLSEGHRSAGEPERENHIRDAVQAARPDAILHFAANALVGESMTNPGKHFHNNVVNG